MAVVVRRFTNKAFGFPARGNRRRIKPVALACIHITGNNRTGKMDEDQPHSGCEAEWSFANRPASGGPSAHLYVARDGFAIEAIDASHHAAWSNGDVTSPSTTNPGIARVLALRAKGYNANEAYWEEIENVGGSLFPLTPAQIETCAQRVAARARLSGLPISRQTVHGHWEINGINRQNCPAPKAVHEAAVDKIVTRARAIAGAAGGSIQGSPMAQPAGQTMFRFGGQPNNRGDYVVDVATARQRRSPFIRADNLIGSLPRGKHFHVRQTSDQGSLVAGSRRWHGNNDGTIWMHSSVISPA